MPRCAIASGNAFPADIKRDLAAAIDAADDALAFVSAEAAA